MAPPNPQSSFHLRINVDFTEIRRRLRSEYGTAIQSDADNEISNDIDKDLDDCDAEVRRLQSRIIFLQNHRERLEEYKGCLRFLRSPIRRLPNETVLRDLQFRLRYATNLRRRSCRPCLHW
ncbi:hypothetical protein BT96DRAFT_419340 [Gymnopus androsaceus JB14]|uniref:Uncharacterized protein n=1 Tax=Gymnopus androsaceus JB14 TaxID=1447944 RepID=A0A6A4I6V0_9AGAR|nr:hypothetical protein BT96DRAFT_419340 [Gymnopus androsaceus JB14]